MIWGTTPSGDFTVKATWIAHDIHPHQPECEFQWIWKLDIPPRIHFFLRQICHKSILVRDTLYKRNILPFDLCPLCDTYIETINHLLFQLPSSKKIWHLDFKKKWLNFSNTHNDFFDTIQYLSKHPSTLFKFILHIYGLFPLERKINDYSVYL